MNMAMMGKKEGWKDVRKLPGDEKDAELVEN